MEFEPEVIGPVIGLVGVFVIIVFVAVFATRTLKARREKYQQMAGMLGLNFVTEGPVFLGLQMWHIEGTYNGAQVDIREVTEGSGKSSHTYLQYSAFFPANLNVGLHIYKEGFFSKIGKALGGQDIQTGSPDFDNQFVLKATDESAAMGMLSNPNAQHEVTAVFALSNMVWIDDECVRVRFSAYKQRELTEHQQILDQMSRTVKAIVGKTGTK